MERVAPVDRLIREVKKAVCNRGLWVGQLNDRSSRFLAIATPTEKAMFRWALFYITRYTLGIQVYRGKPLIIRRFLGIPFLSPFFVRA